MNNEKEYYSGIFTSHDSSKAKDAIDKVNLKFRMKDIKISSFLVGVVVALSACFLLLLLLKCNCFIQPQIKVIQF